MSDKAAHFRAGVEICFAVTLVFGIISYKYPLPFMLIGLASGVLAGIAKELYDLISGRGTFEWMDMTATAAGSIAMNILSLIYLGGFTE